MIFKLPKFLKGKAGTLLETENAETVRRFLECVQNAQIIEGETNKVIWSEKNVKFVVKPSGVTTSSAQTFLFVNQVGGDNSVYVDFGTVGNEVPTNLASTFPISANTEVWLKIEMEANGTTGYKLKNSLIETGPSMTENPAPSQDPAQFYYYKLAVITYSGGTIEEISNTGNGSIGVILHHVGNECLVDPEGARTFAELKDIIFYR